MRITKQIRKNHQQLSECYLKFIEFIENNPESLKQSNYQKILEANNMNITFQAWPMFINEDFRKQLKTASVSVFNLIKDIFSRVFENNLYRISKYFQFPLPMVHYFLAGINNSQVRHLLGRGDFVFSPRGLTCIEFNVSANLGGWEEFYWQDRYLENPIISKFLNQHSVKINEVNVFSILFDHLTAVNIGSFSPHHEEINIAFAIPNVSASPKKRSNENYFNRFYQEVLHRYNRGLKGKIILCDYPQLKYNGQHVMYNDTIVHTIVEYYDGLVPPEMLAPSKEGKVLIYNGSITGLMSNKLTLAIISEHEDSSVFTLDERRIIKKHVPWTRKIVDGESTYQGTTIKLVDFILSNREKLVIKPATGVGGKRVMVGANTPGAEWQETVKTAVSAGGNNWADIKIDPGHLIGQWSKLYKLAQQQNTWVVQEYVEPYTYVFRYGEDGYAEHHVVWGIFALGSRYAGGFSRLLPTQNNSGVINRCQGAEETIILEVDE